MENTILITEEVLRHILVLHEENKVVAKKNDDKKTDDKKAEPAVEEGTK
jgi:ribosomal protein S6